MNLSAQREAILGLAAALRPCIVGSPRRYFMNRREVFLLGFSSDHYCNTPTIAVFGPEPGRGHRTAAEEDRICAGAVYLRSSASGEEADEAASLFGPAAEVEVVEAVTIAAVEPRQFVLATTGDKSAYPVLITAYRSGAG